MLPDGTWKSMLDKVAGDPAIAGFVDKLHPIGRTLLYIKENDTQGRRECWTYFDEKDAGTAYAMLKARGFGLEEEAGGYRIRW